MALLETVVVASGNISTGLVSAYIWEKVGLPSRTKKFFPALYNKGNEEFVKYADRVCGSVVEEMREKYKHMPAINRALSDKNIYKNGLIKMILDHAFIGEVFESKKANDFIKQFADTNDEPRLGNPSKIVDDIKDKLLAALRANTKTGTYLQTIAVAEIQSNILELSNNVKRENHKSITGNDHEKIVEFTKSYIQLWKDSVVELTIHGFDAVTRRERVKNQLDKSFVPLHLECKSLIQHSTNIREDAEGVIQELSRVIIRGDAGSGKTTLLHWLILGADIEIDSGMEGLEIPLYIPLRRIERDVKRNYSLEEALIEAMPSQIIKGHLPLNWLEKMTSMGAQLVFMFDGIDEVRDKSRDVIWELVAKADRLYPNSKIIITSRNISAIHLSNGEYRPDLLDSQENYSELRKYWKPPIGFFEFQVSKLTNVEIINFIEKWFDGVDPEILPPAQRRSLKSYPEKLKSELFDANNRNALELSRMPLLLSLVCMVFYIKLGQFPESKKELYDYATTLLVETRDEKRGVDVEPEFVDFTLPFRLELLKRIALTMQEGVEKGKPDHSVEVQKSKVTKWVGAFFEKQVKEWSFNENDVIKFLLDRCTILREPALGKIDFVHRSFMEYLAAELITEEREAHSIRNHIFKDEWLNTLQFCMDTEAGGKIFSGMFIEAAFDAINVTKTAKRPYFLRLLSLLKHADPTKNYDAVIERLLLKCLPVLNETELDDFLGVPARILNKTLKLENVREKYGKKAISLSAQLLSRHPSEDTKIGLLSGYQNEPDIETIQLINESGKLTISEHFALKQRIKNKSFFSTVIVQADELSDRSIRFNFLRGIGIRFPFKGDRFVGWDVLHHCSNIKLINLTPEDISSLVESQLDLKWKFDNCRHLELIYPNGVTFTDLGALFPALEELEIIRGSAISLNGLRQVTTLKRIMTIGLAQPLTLVRKELPKELNTIIMINSTEPTTWGDFSDITFDFEDTDQDRVLYNSVRIRH